jgi:hypothetical protein
MKKSVLRLLHELVDLSEPMFKVLCNSCSQCPLNISSWQNTIRYRADVE